MPLRTHGKYDFTIRTINYANAIINLDKFVASYKQYDGIFQVLRETNVTFTSYKIALI
jgi:uncharacterized protein YutD